MLNFLKGSRKLLNASEPVCVVIGNESCDLDSAVCALALAFYYQQLPPTSITKKRNFLPVLNIPRRDFPLKTEVTYFLQKHQITEDTLTFRDELDQQQQRQQTSKSDFILVDHHVSPFAKQCIQVYDHRPFDESASKLPTNCRLTLEPVGSCSTLIAETIITGGGIVDEFSDVLRFLHGAIVMDTVNFSEEAARATAKDRLITEKIEQILGIEDSLASRLQIFQELCAAREDVSSLSAHQLLYKDMKLLTNNQGTLRVALPGFPIRVQDFLQKTNVTKAINEFARELDCNIVMLIGMKVYPDGSVQRDIGLININNQRLYDEILRQLLNCKEPALCLSEVRNCEIMNGKFYNQGNIRATRKHTLPIVKRILDQWKGPEN